jgi:addiction module HigA family antidote
VTLDFECSSVVRTFFTGIEILLTEFLEAMGISQYRIAKVIDVPPRRINEIVHGKRGISADTGLRLWRALGLSDMFSSTCRRTTTLRWPAST